MIYIYYIYIYIYYNSDIHLSISDPRMLPCPPRAAQPPRPRSQLRVCPRQHPGWRPGEAEKGTSLKQRRWIFLMDHGDHEYRMVIWFYIVFMHMMDLFVGWAENEAALNPLDNYVVSREVAVLVGAPHFQTCPYDLIWTYDGNTNQEN